MTYKTIFKGRLEFGSNRSYDQVLKMYQHRVENYYKSDVLLDEEEIFDEESFSLNVPRFITQSSEKSLKNTVSLLEYVAQFAIAGNLIVWMTNNGNILRHNVVEPTNDRSTVQAFLKGRKLSNQQGKETEAMKALNKAISKYEKHGQAYERRGHVNFHLKNYEEALADYHKSTEYSPNNPEAYFGKARVKEILDDKKGAISEYTMVIKMSIPLEPIYWTARRNKAMCHIDLEDYEGALLDLKLFCNRKLKPDNPNYVWRKFVNFQYGIALAKTGKEEEAADQMKIALEIEEGTEYITNKEIEKQLGVLV